MAISISLQFNNGQLRNSLPVFPWQIPFLCINIAFDKLTAASIVLIFEAHCLTILGHLFF